MHYTLGTLGTLGTPDVPTPRPSALTALEHATLPRTLPHQVSTLQAGFGLADFRLSLVSNALGVPLVHFDVLQLQVNRERDLERERVPAVSREREGRKENERSPCPRFVASLTNCVEPLRLFSSSPLLFRLFRLGVSVGKGD